MATTYNKGVPLRVAAISFLNPAPLLYNFEHEPTASQLAQHYALHYTTPANCAAELLSGTADLGLIPIASLTPELAIVPGCTIASLREVRSILLLVKNPKDLPRDEALNAVRTVAADAASRSSQAYTHILFEHFHHTKPAFLEHFAEPLEMLVQADAALLIGDPALLAREHRAVIEAAYPGLLWLDLAALWRELTGLPWVAAVWAVREEAIDSAGLTSGELVRNLVASRDAGLRNIEGLVREWTPRLEVSAETIRTYLTENIHYVLDEECVKAVVEFRRLAAGIGVLPELGDLRILR